MYQVLHDTNNVTDSRSHGVSVTVPITHPASRVVGSSSGSVASSSELFRLLLLGPVFEIKAGTSKSGNGVGRG